MSIYKICLTVSLSLHLTKQKAVYSGKRQLTRSWTEANQIEAPPGYSEQEKITEDPPRAHHVHPALKMQEGILGA